MAEKRDGEASPSEKLAALTAELVDEAYRAKDAKAHAAVEAKARSMAAVIRTCAMMTDLLAKEDNMSTNQHGGDEARMARADQLREEILRRLARIRTGIEDKAMAEDPERGAD